MKDFSNETKSKRRKAILKVILKRYSFIVWVPALLVLLNFIGIITNKVLASSPAELTGLIYYLDNIMFGLLSSMVLITSIMIIILMIKSLIEYLKKGTIVEDFIENIKIIIELFVVIFLFFIKLPKRIFLRIKDEKRRFNNSLEKELKRNKND